MLTIQNKDAVENVQAGSKRLIPFITMLANDLGPKVNAVINPNAEEVFSPISPVTVIKSSDIESVYQGAEENLTDGDDTTYVWYKAKDNTIKSGGYIGLDLGRNVKLGKIRILQGSSDSNNTIVNAALEYSQDGENYTQIKPYVNQKDIEINAADLNIKARYVRLKATANTGKWLSLREFAISESSGNVLSPALAYTNVAVLGSRPVMVMDDSAELKTSTQKITLGAEKYIGIVLPGIRELIEVQAEYTNEDKLQIEYSLNGEEWNTIKDISNINAQSTVDARYIRIINKGGADVTFNLSKLAVKSSEIKAVNFLESNIESSNIETPDKAFDKDLTTMASFTVLQNKGQHMTWDLGKKRRINKLKFIVADGAVDFLRNGELSVSADNQTWSDAIVTISDKGKEDAALSDIYQNEVPYYSISSKENLGLEARYIKLEVTKNYGLRWTRINEILINDGEYVPVENNRAFITTAIEEEGHQPAYLMDGDVSTTYLSSLSSEKNGTGSIIYRVSDNTNITGITILQSPDTISNATVSVRVSETEWKDIGTLNKSFNTFGNTQLTNIDNIYEIKIQWADGAPELNEMYLVKKKHTVIQADKSDLQRKYNEAKQFEAKYYTAASYAVLDTAMQNASGILEYEASTKEEISAASDALMAAIDGLEDITPDAAALEDKIEAAETINPSLYTSESYENLSVAVSDAKAAISANVKQKVLDEKLALLEKAIAALVPAGTLTKIPFGEMTAAAESEQNRGSDGPASWAIDNNEGIWWHSNWSNNNVDITNNQNNEFTIDVGKTRILRKLE